MSAVISIWRILPAAQRRAALLMQLVAVIAACSTAAGVAAIAPFFAVLGDPGLIERNPVMRWLYASTAFASPRSLMWALGATFVAIVVLANALGVLAAIAMNRLALGIGAAIQSTLFQAYLERPYSFHLRTHSSVLCNNLVYQTARLTHGVLENLFTLITNVLAAILIVASIALAGAPVALAVVAMLAAGYGAIYSAVRARLLLIGQHRTELANEQGRLLRDSFGAIREILLRGAQSLYRERFERLCREFLRTTTRVELLAQLPRNFMESVAAAGLVALALALAGQDGGLGPRLGTLSFLGFAAYRLLPILQQIFAAIVRLRADMPVVAILGPDLQEVRTTPLPAHRARRAATPPSWPGAPCRSIATRELWYRHAPQRDWVLRGASLDIPAHSLVAVTGTSGSGKSTLLELMCALLVPARGCLEVDGRVVNDHTRPAWQARVAYLPQQLFLFDDSIAANIALGLRADDIDMARLQEAGRLAQLDDFVWTLPGNYAARIGENGVTLSGGQRQRIGLARALYHRASMLLLDEPTSALDSSTELALVRSLLRLRERCTIVLVTHRPGIARLCDRVIELEGGLARNCGLARGLPA